jgi:hypothetical protein
MKIYGALILVFLCASFSSGETENNLTDEELQNICIRNAGRKLTSDIVGIWDGNISIVESLLEKDDKSNFILIESITNEIKNLNRTLFLKEEDAEIDKPILSFRIIEKNVTVEEETHFFGDPTIVRNAGVKISFRLVDPVTREILIAKEIEESLENRISKKEYENLEKGVKKKGTSFASLLEPAIVTAIIGGLMYLFYSSKSSK